MSMINRALKKAQRERLLHEAQTVPHLTRLTPSPRHPGRWWLVTIGVVSLSVVALYAWLATPEQRATGAAGPQGVTTPLPVSTHRRPSASPITVQPSVVAMARDASPGVPPLRPSSSRAKVRPAATPQPTTSPPSTDVQRRVALAPKPPAPSTLALSTLAPKPPAPSPKARARARRLFNQAVESREAGQRTRALSLLHQVIRLDPALKVAYNSLGNLYYQQQQYQRALTMYQQALSIDPHDVKARNNSGSAYLRLQKDERAREEFHKALQADSAYGLAYYNLACVHARAGDSATAVQYLQQAIRLEPQARTWAQTDDDFARVRPAPEMQHRLGSS